jgi:uncharacterized protein (TIGR00251 family)
MEPDWVSPDPRQPGHALVRVRAQPGVSRARQSAVAGLWNNSLKLCVSAPPEDGRANEALVELLAELLGLAPNRILLVRGEKARAKQFRVAMDPQSVRARLAPHLGGKPS